MIIIILLLIFSCPFSRCFKGYLAGVSTAIGLSTTANTRYAMSLILFNLNKTFIYICLVLLFSMHNNLLQYLQSNRVIILLNFAENLSFHIILQGV